MINVVMLYKLMCPRDDEFFRGGVRYSLQPWKDVFEGTDNWIDGGDDGGKDYVLPEGYQSVALDGFQGLYQIRDSKGRIAELYTSDDGAPAVMDLDTKRLIVLEEFDYIV
ncbi:hypothetical protein [Paenibacillus sp. y28]|uniref:hypothetical protein n=1 Tax=Paenibacillus sp. y28 TaxID=3129110 RepID=UPI0030183820